MKIIQILKYISVALAAQVFLASGALAQLSAEDKREIIFDCTLLVNDYAYYRDLHDPENFANLFTEDARMTARGEWLSGREALADHVLHDDPNAVSMHMVSTVKITPIDETNATGVTYAAVANEQKGEGGPATLESFTVIGQYFDKFVKTEDGWKISERIFTVIYRKPS